jgi:hypothetical protein
MTLSRICRLVDADPSATFAAQFSSPQTCRSRTVEGDVNHRRRGAATRSTA